MFKAGMIGFIATLTFFGCGIEKPASDASVDAETQDAPGAYDTEGLTVPLCSTLSRAAGAVECSDATTAICVRLDGSQVIGCALVNTVTDHLVSCVAACEK